MVQNNEIAVDHPIMQLQQILCSIYDLPEIQDVRNFLIDADTYGRFVPPEAFDPEVREEVLIRCHEDNSVELSLYLNGEVLKNLHAHRPENRLDERNLADFFALVEGLSHFLLISFRTHHELPTSVLELELQGEIDKFIAGFIWQYQKSGTHHTESLKQRLFKSFRLRPTLSKDREDRYRLASQKAEKLCARLERKFLLPKINWPGLLKFLRRFYRQSSMTKMAIASSALF